MRYSFTLKSRAGTSSEAHRQRSRGKITKSFGNNAISMKSFWLSHYFFVSLRQTRKGSKGKPPAPTTDDCSGGFLCIALDNSQVWHVY